MRTTTLGELVDEAGGIVQTGPFGSQLHAHDYSNSGVAVVMPQNIRNGRLDHSSIAHVTTGRASGLSRHTLQAGDIVYSRRGDVEKCALVLETDLPAMCGTGSLLVRVPKSHFADSTFLAYLLQTDEVRKWVRGHAVGATMLNLNTQILREVPLVLPPLPKQQAIAEVLGALDDKIAANRALVATADDLATAIYRRESSTTAPLSSLAKFVNGRNFTKDASGTGRAVIRIAELNSGIGDSTVFNDVGALPQNVAGPGDILFAWSGSLTLKRWTAEEGLVNQHIFKVIPNSDVPQWLVYQAIRHALPDFKAIAADKATTMGHIQRHHLDAKVPIPTTSQTVPLDPLMGGLWQMALAAEVESATLAALRDTLLPALMNGTLRVKDAERTVSEAL
ncbi:restriction endonuclease subunit S [Cutibacterium avidum]|uniref:restriction endonuclease subunit S n=1 Tax=Cutibacterium avidum TaxID=33010 RepID=UPI00083E86D8|nr:restriction endonuclease subunit S [Cutibacterium avidum]AOG27969.1 hypothetical protein BFS79_04915 [Cutibacterium avidum]